MERSVLQGLAAFRWGAWAWMAAVVVVSRDSLSRPWLAVLLVGAALAVTVADTYLLRTDPDRLLTSGPVLVELAVGAALVVADGWAYGHGHAFSTSQSLGSVWPLAGVLAVGIVLGPLGGIAAGTVLGISRMGATLANGAHIDTSGRVLSVVNSVVFYALAGAVAGYLMTLLRRAEREISAARAREEVARTLHDGVLQTLAVVERRSGDPALARLAREQERELREYLFGTRPPTAGADLAAALRASAARFEDAFGGRAEVVVAPDLPELEPDRCEALAGAVGEALTNAGKHGAATRVTIFVEPDDEGGVFCSVKDDGRGFDTAVERERPGVGIARSIRGRMQEVGGRAEIRSRLGAGTEVCLWL